MLIHRSMVVKLMENINRLYIFLWILVYFHTLDSQKQTRNQKTAHLVALWKRQDVRRRNSVDGIFSLWHTFALWFTKISHTEVSYTRICLSVEQDSDTSAAAVVQVSFHTCQTWMHYHWWNTSRPGNQLLEHVAGDLRLCTAALMDRESHWSEEDFWVFAQKRRQIRSL